MSKAQTLIADMRAWAADEEEGTHLAYSAMSKVNGPVAFSRGDILGKTDSEMLGMLQDRLVKPQPRE